MNEQNIPAGMIGPGNDTVTAVAATTVAATTAVVVGAKAIVAAITSPVALAGAGAVAAYKFVGYLHENYQQEEARKRQAEQEREDRLHQQKIDQINYEHRQKMEAMDDQIAATDRQIQEMRDTINEIKKKNNPETKEKQKPEIDGFGFKEGKS